MDSVIGNDDERRAQGVVEIVAPELEPLIAFYTALGFQVERRTAGFAVLSGHGLRLFLAEDADAPTTPRWTNLRIIVDDVDAVWHRFAEQGFDASSPPTDRSYGLRDFSLTDPAGFEVRFAQPL